MANDPRDQRMLRLVGANLRAERSRAGLSQEELAHRAQLPTQNSISRLENADGDAGITRYARAAWALGIPLADLFRGVDDLDP